MHGLLWTVAGDRSRWNPVRSATEKTIFAMIRKSPSPTLPGICALVATCAGLLVAGSAAAQGAAAAPAAPVRNAPEKFDIAAFDVVGVSKLDPAIIENAVYRFAGPDRTSADVQAARTAIETAYRAAGYESVTVDVPPQPAESFVAKIILLQVVESVVGRVRVTGSRYHAPTIVLAQLPALQAGQLPDLRALGGQLSEANRFPDREISTAIKEGSIPGTIDIDLRVRDSLPLHASVEVNNDHNSLTEPLRVAASARYTNVWQLGHTISGTYLVAPQDRSQLEVFSGSYLAPILGSRWTLLAYGYKSNSNVAALGGTSVLGDGYAVGARAIYRLPGRIEQSVTFGADYKDFKEDILIPNENPALPPAEINTPIAYVPLVISYGRQQYSETSAFNLTVGVTAGIRGLGTADRIAQEDEATLGGNRRSFSVGNFVHFNLDADYTRALGGDFSAFARLSAQLADSPLYTNEQFGVGGITSVRGYFQSEAVGDDGVNGTFEVRSPTFAGIFGSYVDELRVFGFADGGFVRVRSALAGQQEQFTLVSVGAGTRFQLFKYLKANLAYGVALLDGSVTEVGDGQFTFSVKAEF